MPRVAAESRSGVCSRVLHALRCVGVVGVATASAASGVSSGELEECLQQLADEGLAMLTPGHFGGWRVTDAGRLADDQWVSRELEVPGAREEVHSCYARFLGLNPSLLQICSDWQMRRIGSTPSVNDHTDADYDAKVLTRLMRIDESAQNLCAELTGTLDRFAVYQERLSSALEQAIAGNHGYVADGLDSYHTIWFQLHEDLLTTLGISRDEERRNSEGLG